MATIYSILQFMAVLFVFAMGLLVLAVIVMFVMDVTQTKHAVRRNFPVIGRFRYWFETLGEFFRQYFFAGDREELPFNRAERSYVYRSAKNIDSTQAFGSTRDLRPVGTPIFVNCPYPALAEETHVPSPIAFGMDCRKPYAAPSFFNVSAMSFGALSVPAVRALSLGTTKAGCWLNTGEGGVSPYHVEGGGDVVFQIGTAKYGVRNNDGSLSEAKLKKLMADCPQIKMIELKLSQGAKPGKGGILPGEKVTKTIAEIRGIEEGKPSISPNRHPEIDSAADLLDMIHRLREISGVPVGFKAVMGAYGWIDELCEAIHARGIESAPDFIAIDSADGGTGAAPVSLMDNMGLPIKESLPLVVDQLVKHGLRDRIKVIASGKLITPAEAAWALCAGADVITSARGFMFSLGCIQALHCNKNTCPTGITTHNKRLQRGLVVENKAARVAHYHKNMVKEIETIAHACGVPEPKRLQRMHCRVVTETGQSIPLDELYPAVQAKAVA